VSEPGLVTTLRDGFPESRHRIHAVVVRSDGSTVARCGDPDRITTMRSAAKPFQAEPLVASGGLDALALDDRVLAVMCASHSGQDIHVEAIRRGLAACGLDASALANSLGTPEELKSELRGDAIVALGAVVRGETAHFDYVASEAARGVAAVHAATGVPAGFGGLTVDTLAQALDRAGGKHGNKGADAAVATIEMVSLLRELRRPRASRRAAS